MIPPRVYNIPSHLSVNPTSGSNPVNDTDGKVTDNILTKVCNALGLPNASKVSMASEVPRLQEEMDHNPNLEHTPLTVFTDKEGNPKAMLLRRAPVFLAAVQASTKTWSHLFAFVGEPGKGGDGGRLDGIKYVLTKMGLRGGGINYFSMSGDGDRGVVIVKDLLAELAKLTKLPTGMQSLPDGGNAALDAINKMNGREFLNHEDFHMAYMETRLTAAGYPPDSDKPIPDELIKTIHLEFDQLNIQVPKSSWELHDRTPNGRDAEMRGQTKNLGEKDMRIAEEEGSAQKISKKELYSGKTIKSANINFRRVEGADPLKLIEVQQRYRLFRHFGDEFHGRIGTSKRPRGFNDPDRKIVSLETLQKFVAGMSLYKLTSPLTGKTGNCASGVAQFLRDAGVPEEHILAPSNYAFGLHNVVNRWNPLKKSQSAPAPVKVRQENPDIDTSSLRNGPTNVADLHKHLLEQVERIRLQKLSNSNL